MFLSRLFSRNPHADAAHALYGTAVARAREPMFYADLGVPDTLEGRFEMISLHVYLLLRRLKAARDVAADGVAQTLFDLMFADMDRNLREMGAGDLGVGRRVKAMAQAFYGRVSAYDEGLEADDVALSAAIARNVYAGADGADKGAAVLAQYLRAAEQALAAADASALIRGAASFGPLPEQAS
jgi:cytochrome b pre-mRNA-processing protein 3